MKTRITALYFGDGIKRYLVEHREHWWQRWHYVMDGHYPRLFTWSEVKEIKEEKYDRQ